MCTLIFVSNCFYIEAIFDFETLSKINFVKTLKFGRFCKVWYGLNYSD